MPPTDAPKRGLSRTTRNRLLLLLGAAVVVFFALTFAFMTRQALSLRAQHSSEFAQYVMDHGIGRAEVASDASGFQADFCVLHLTRPPSGNRLKADTIAWMHQYVALDGGTSLTVVYDDPRTGSQVTEADAVYRPDRHMLYVTVHQGPGAGTYRQRVDWGSGDD
jgi:hypothetical protein